MKRKRERLLEKPVSQGLPVWLNLSAPPPVGSVAYHSAFQTIMCKQSPADLVKMEILSPLVWIHPRLCVSNMLPGNAKAVGLQATF